MHKNRMIHPELKQLYDKAYEFQCTDIKDFKDTLHIFLRTGNIDPENVIILNEFLLSNLKRFLPSINNTINFLMSILNYSNNVLNNIETIKCEEWLKDAVYKDTISVIELVQHLIDIENGMNDQ
jgi:hypothetical protein